MTPNHTPGSGEIAERIRKAWLARNPKPEGVTLLTVTEEDLLRLKARGQWLRDQDRLETMLGCEAYESAVIQFLVLDDLRLVCLAQYMDGGDPPWFAKLGNRDKPGGRPTQGGSTPAEALLAAIEETNRDRG